jgi:hypothetical protein
MFFRFRKSRSLGSSISIRRAISVFNLGPFESQSIRRPECATSYSGRSLRAIFSIPSETLVHASSLLGQLVIGTPSLGRTCIFANGAGFQFAARTITAMTLASSAPAGQVPFGLVRARADGFSTTTQSPADLSHCSPLYRAMVRNPYVPLLCPIIMSGLNKISHIS